MKTKGKIREYCEGRAVSITTHKDRLVVKAFNDSGWNSTEVDIVDLIRWLLKYKRDVVMREVINGG